MNVGHYDTKVIGECMYIMTLMRTMFGICVPMFMLLTGYLMICKDIIIERKTLLKFYLKISQIILVYVFATIIIIAFGYFILKIFTL